MKGLLFILIALSFTGSSFSLVEVSGISFNVFRIMLVIFTFFHAFYKGREKIVFPAKEFYKKVMIAFALFSVGTFFMAYSTMRWLNGTLYIIINVLLIYYIMAYSDSKKDIEFYMKAYAIGLFVNFAIAVYEYITGTHIIEANYLSEYHKLSWEYQALAKAPTALLYNPNNIGVAALLGVSFAGVIKTDGKKTSIMAVKLGWYALCIYVALITGSRGAILLVLVAIATYMLVEKVSAARKTMYVIVIALGLVWMISEYGDFFWEQIRYSGLLRQNALVDAKTDSFRINAIIEGFKASKSYAFLGTGPMGAEMMLYNQMGVHMSIHNFWIEWLMTEGIGGLICFLCMYIHCMKAMFRSKSYQSKMILTSLIIFSVASMIPPTILTLHFVWMLFGFSIAIEKIDYMDAAMERKEI